MCTEQEAKHSFQYIYIYIYEFAVYSSREQPTWKDLERTRVTLDQLEQQVYHAPPLIIINQELFQLQLP